MRVNSVKLKFLLVATLTILILAACSSGPGAVEDGVEETSSEGTGGEPAQEESTDSEADDAGAIVDDPMVAEALKATSGQRFEGQTVVVVGVSGDQGEFLKTAAAGWEAATGATVELNLMPFGELQDKVLVALSTGAPIGDVLNVPAYMAGDLMGGGFIEPVPEEVKERLQWDDIMPLYKEQTQWGGETYGYPWDGDILSMYYRKDLITDPEHQAAFEGEYGYPLDVPTTWQQYEALWFRRANHA